MVETSKMYKPVAISGAAVALFTTVIGIIPIVNMCNLLCCFWLIGAGILAAYLLKKDVGAIEVKDGAIVGALSGVVFAIVDTFFTALLMLANVGGSMAVMRDAFAEAGLAASMGLIAVGIIIVLVFLITLVLGVIFCAIGGALGAKLMESGKPSKIEKKAEQKVA